MAQRIYHGEEHRHCAAVLLVVGACIWLFDYVAVSAVHLLIGLAG